MGAEGPNPRIAQARAIAEAETWRRIDSALHQALAREDLKIPPYPAIATQLARLVGSFNYSPAAVRKLVEADQALAASVLRAANTATARAGGTITSIERALAQIGAQELLRRAYATSLGAWSAGPGHLVELRHRVWRDAVASAFLAHHLAPLRHVQPDDAFLAGLLHDFGKLVVLASLEADIAQSGGGPRPAEAWMGVVERFHVEAGTVVGRRWGLPPSLLAAVACHHDLAQCPPQHRDLVDLLGLVDRIVGLLDQHPHLDAATLATVDGFTPAERAAAARAIGGLAEAVNGLIEQANGIRSVASGVAQPTRAIGTPGYPLELTVVGERRSGDLFFLSTEIAYDGLAVIGREALPVNHLMKISIDMMPDPLVCFANVVLTTPSTDGHRIELKPYALSGEPAKQWARLHDHARTAATSAAAARTPAGSNASVQFR